VAFDVTDIREAQARLLESETRFRTVADSAPVQMWMTDEAGRVVFANRRYRTFFNVRRDEDLEENWRAIMTANGLEAFYSGFLTALEQRDRYENIMEVMHPRWAVAGCAAKAFPASMARAPSRAMSAPIST